ncbi:MAG: hypothetical protein ACR2QC_05220 [Gammaproteobacteria bacterium]
MTKTREKARAVLREIVSEYVQRSDAGKWSRGAFASINRVEKGLRGEVGEDFAVAMLQMTGYGDAEKLTGRSSRRQKAGAFDIRANGRRIEVKTASEDVHGKFQFNGIKYNGKTPYDVLLLVGVAPDDAFFRMLRKDEIPKGLPMMAKNTPGTHKLTLSPNAMFSLENFAEQAAKYLGAE